MKDLLRKPFILLTDFIFGLLPQSKPSFQSLKNAKIVAHRGWHDNHNILENTLPAFEMCLNTGLYGVEFDIRWTSDYVPVVHHDESCQRVFGVDLLISKVSFSELRSKVASIPSLEEVLALIDHDLHLFIEIKAQDREVLDTQFQVLKSLLQDYKPIEDYHILAVQDHILQEYQIFPNDCKVLVGDLSIRSYSKLAVENAYGGIATHYSFLSQNLIATHHDIGQIVGSGYPRSKNVLYREINRGVDLIFTNHPWEILKFLP